MGSRGSFLESGGFKAPARWETVDYVDGIKVLASKESKGSISLPERSNTPGASYVAYGKDGVFKQFITFDENRMPVYRIDYGMHQGKISLHIHYFKDGDGLPNPPMLKKGDKLYEKHKNLFKGVKI